MHILVTNDDGVHAPGLACLASAAAQWATADASGNHAVSVVAPLSNHSGASAAVGSVTERDKIQYRSVHLDGLEHLTVYGVDAPPALSVIAAALGAFGPRPDLVLSGINLGVNIGRSILHSGTVGAVLTAAQLGLRGLAVSLRSGTDPPPWDTASVLAMSVLHHLPGLPERTVLNLNVPSLPLADLRGVRYGHIDSASVIRSARDIPLASTTDTSHPGGYLMLTLGSAVPALGDVTDEDPTGDAALVAAGFASLTPLRGVKEDGANAATVAALAAHIDATRIHTTKVDTMQIDTRKIGTTQIATTKGDPATPHR